MDYITTNGLIWSLIFIVTVGASVNEDMKGQFDLILYSTNSVDCVPIIDFQKKTNVFVSHSKMDYYSNKIKAMESKLCKHSNNVSHAKTFLTMSHVCNREDRSIILCY